jgi:hypothetical protein
MPTTYKVLGQVEYDGTGEDTLYTVPGSTQSVCSTLAVCNKNAANQTFDVRLKINNAVDDDKQLLIFEAPVLSKDTLFITVGLTLNAGDVVTVKSSSTDVTFQLFGTELS